MSDFLTIEQAIPAFDPAGVTGWWGRTRRSPSPPWGWLFVPEPAARRPGPRAGFPATRIAHLLAERAHRSALPTAIVPGPVAVEFLSAYFDAGIRLWEAPGGPIDFTSIDPSLPGPFRGVDPQVARYVEPAAAGDAPSFTPYAEAYEPDDATGLLWARVDGPFSRGSREYRLQGALVHPPRQPDLWERGCVDAPPPRPVIALPGAANGRPPSPVSWMVCWMEHSDGGARRPPLDGHRGKVTSRH